jgi:hypothetical protein
LLAYDSPPVYNPFMNDSNTDTLPLFAGSLLAEASANALASASFTDSVRDFCGFGAPTVEVSDGPIPYLINEFWTSGQRQAHSIHDVSYRACFKAQLPEFFIARLTSPRDAVYDPFMGRGTTPVQAALMGRRPVGSDINPLSVLLSRPRMNPPTLDQIARRLDQVPWHLGEIENAELLAFYSSRTLAQICALRS